MIAEREALRMGIEHLSVSFPTEVSSFDFQVESTDRTVQYKLNAQSLRLFGLHRDVNDAHRASANRLQNKNKQVKRKVSPEEQKGPKRGPFPSRKTDRLPDLRVLPGHWSQRFRRELCRPIYYCSSK